ncbi:MAG: hypothetical protein OXU20_26925 [Myxococcales bacterium]|nr:hypothetical protein [Myxococcales bacterium]MDD9971419.1 hypothetical protein [Myxococcales bacterium]
MYTITRYLDRGLWAIFLSVAMLGCTSEEEKAPGATAASEIGRPLNDVELPVSLRTSDPSPGTGAMIEATVEQLRFEGQPVITLDRGKVPDAERSGGVIPKLKAKLNAGHASLNLRLQANIPYETVALALNTAKQAGISNTAFQVRKTGASKEKGWIVIKGFQMTSKADDLPTLPGTEAMSWNAFTDKWQQVFDGCRTSKSGNCAYVNENVAEGGTLRMELFASGRGVNVNFFRRGLSREQEQEEDKKRAQQLAQKKEDFLQGRITKDEMVEALLLGHPSTYALFQYRYQEALTGPSALSATISPVCSGRSCPLVVTADKITHFVRIASMIGAAFPSGSQLPSIAFEMPWTERPKPADLKAFIEEQQAL